MHILVCGSLAFDRIMPFPGRFSDHILPDKIHILNVCFLVNGVDEKFGGTAGNIAYNLALLGEKPLIVGCAGKDFGPYEAWLQELGLPLDGIRRIPGEHTAGAYITTDLSDNQITGFNPGAMRHPAQFDVSGFPAAETLAIVSPGNVSDMIEYPRLFRKLGIRYIFDPGQQITALSGPDMLEAITGSYMLVTNDYELEMVIKATGQTRDQIKARTSVLATTLGEKGALLAMNGEEIRVPAARAERTLDPTGAGDAWRAGLLRGLAQGKSLDEAARLGAVCAAYAVECRGTQEHRFSQDEFAARYRENFGSPA
jgi:adenosine kinase